MKNIVNNTVSTKSKYHYTYWQLKKECKKIFDLIKRYDENAKLKYNKHTDRSSVYVPIDTFDTQKSNEHILVEIGTETLRNRMLLGYVHDDDFVNTICAGYHELGHVILRKAGFTMKNPPQSIKIAAKISVASQFFDEYYTEGYTNNLEELMCESHALKCLKRHFKKNPISPEIDWENIIVNSIDHNRFMEDTRDEKLRQNIVSFEDFLSALQYKIKIAYDRKRIDEYIGYTPNPSDSLFELSKCGLLPDLVSPSIDGKTEITILLNYIHEHHPETFKGFCCLADEYPAANPKYVFNNTVSKTNAQQTSNNKCLNSQSTPKPVGTPTIDSEPESPGRFSDGTLMPKPAPESQNKDNNEFTL